MNKKLPYNHIKPHKYRTIRKENYLTLISIKIKNFWTRIILKGSSIPIKKFHNLVNWKKASKFKYLSLASIKCLVKLQKNQIPLYIKRKIKLFLRALSTTVWHKIILMLKFLQKPLARKPPYHILILSILLWKSTLTKIIVNLRHWIIIFIKMLITIKQHPLKTHKKSTFIHLNFSWKLSRKIKSSLRHN